MGNIESHIASKDDVTHEESLPLLHQKKGEPIVSSNKNSTTNNNNHKMNRRFSTRNSTSKHHHHRANKLGQDIDVGLLSGIWKWEGTVLSRIWPTVLVFMIYAAGVVFLPTAWVMDTPDTTR